MNWHSQSITVVTIVEYSKFERVIRLFESLTSKLPGYDIRMEVLALCCPKDQRFHKRSQANSPIRIFNTWHKLMPIVFSRNICQDHLKRIMQSRGGIGLILDDDLVWTLPQKKFDEWLSKLKADNSSMALLGMAGDPPVPREYLRAAPLLDFLIDLVKRDEAPESARSYVTRFQCGDVAPDHAHHDYHAFVENGFVPFPFNLSVDDFFSRLCGGKSTTREVCYPEVIYRCSGRGRGGATLVTDSGVLNVRNTTVTHGECVGRRSDMVMAIRAREFGFCIHQTPVALVHDRQPGLDGDDPMKLVGDILGYAYVESDFAEVSVCDLAFRRLVKTRSIVVETSVMLGFCLELDMISVKSREYINRIISKNNRVLDALLRFETDLRKHPIIPMSDDYSQWLSRSA